MVSDARSTASNRMKNPPALLLDLTRLVSRRYAAGSAKKKQMWDRGAHRIVETPPLGLAVQQCLYLKHLLLTAPLHVASE